MEEQKSFYDGKFGKYILPGIVLQSVLIGGGYATGREIVEYGGKFGALGWLAGLGIFIGFAVVCILTFELARLYEIYDYKSMIQEIAGPFWMVFDIVYFLFMIVIIAVMASATGTILEQTLGFSYWISVLGTILTVSVLNFYGAHVIERFETAGTLALYAGYILFSILVISTRFDNITKVFSTMDTSYVPSASIPLVLWTGILYTAYNLSIVPSCFFTLKRQTTRKETVISGIGAGVLMTIPWFLTYFSVMCFYPDDKVMGAAIPWLAMMQGIAGPALIAVFGIIIGWTLIETATGVIHAMLERINAGLKEFEKSDLSRTQQAIITLMILIGATALSKIGIINLISKFYNTLAYAFIMVYLVPLLTVGVYKFVQKNKEKSNAG